MSFELENPEIAHTVSQYKDGEIGYGEAKSAIVSYLTSELPEGVDDVEIKIQDAREQAKKLLLGE